MVNLTLQAKCSRVKKKKKQLSNFVQVKILFQDSSKNSVAEMILALYCFSTLELMSEGSYFFIFCIPVSHSLTGWWGVIQVEKDTPSPPQRTACSLSIHMKLLLYSIMFYMKTILPGKAFNL